MPYNYKTELERYRRYYQSLEPRLGKSKVQNYTAIIFSFLVISLFGLYAIRPTIQTILTLKRQIRDKTEISKKMEDKIAALIEAQAAYSQVETSLPAINQALPDSAEAIPLIIQLRKLANSTGVILVTVQLPVVPLLGREATLAAKPKIPTVAAGNDRFLDFSIGITGPYNAVQAFLSGIQEMRRIVTIKSLDVSSERVTQQQASGSAVPIGQQLQLTMKLTSYYLIQ